MANKIITYLSLPNRDKEPPLCSYAWPTGDRRTDVLNGRQTNEAPLQYFLSTFDFSGPEDRILCLCTAEVREHTLTWCGKTTFVYVEQSLTAYCAEQKIPCPVFVAVPIDSLESDLELALAEIMKQIVPTDRVYIDATGGPRDASFMNILLMQALQYKGCPVVEMVYSFFSAVDQTKNGIRKLNDVSRIMRMTSAMAELTTYGRTRLFEQMSGELDGETVELVKKLHELSEVLEVSSFSAEGQGPNFNKILTEINQTLARCRKSEQVRPLMRQFLPVFREKLSFGNSNITLASVVRWCAENHLLQQSVTIFYENIYTELRNQGILYILPDRHMPDRHISYANDLTSRFLSECADKFPQLYTLSVPYSAVRNYQKYLKEKNPVLQPFVRGGTGKNPSGKAYISLIEPAALLILRCFFQNEHTPRSQTEAARYAVETGHPELLTLIERYHPHTETPEEQWTEFLTRIPDNLFTRPLREAALSIRLEREGFSKMTEEFLKPFLGDTISSMNDRISFSTLGLLLLDCQLTRLIRNQMSHSVIYTEQSVKRGRAGKEMDCFYRMGQSDLVICLPVEEIRNRMTETAERLDSLCAQAASKIGI